MGLRRKLKTAVKPVSLTENEQKYIADNNVQRVVPGRQRPSSKVLEVTEDMDDLKDGVEYITLELKGSTGKIYKVVMPRGYYKLVPKTWSWDEKRYKVAEAISAGFPMTEVAKMYDVPRSVIYGWLQHPEFKEHVDGLTLETGWANQRERIAGLNKVQRLLFDKVVHEIEKVKLTDKSIGAVLSSLQMIAKQIGQEKGEFVEQSKVENNTTLNGAIGLAEIPVEAILNGKTSEERKALEEEFNKLGDDIIRSITGEKE